MTAALTNVAGPSRRRQFAALRALFAELASILLETRAHFAKVSAAHAVQERFSRLGNEVAADVGMPVEDILSAPSYSAELPFFMQRGFGKRGGTARMSTLRKPFVAPDRQLSVLTPPLDVIGA